MFGDRNLTHRGGHCREHAHTKGWSGSDEDPPLSIEQARIDRHRGIPQEARKDPGEKPLKMIRKGGMRGRGLV